ncbi:hypothetical protein [Macrococcus hajekii]|nr:hypothetical protein [Macrococcus hajekii]
MKEAYKKYPHTYPSFNREYAYNVNGHMVYFQTADGKYVAHVVMGNH